MNSATTSTAATIAAAGTVSTAVDVRWFHVVGVVIPSAWTAAGVAFQVSPDNGTTYYPVKRPEVGTTTAPVPVKNLELLAADIPTNVATFIPLNPAWFAGATHVKVVSQTAGSGVAQDADRSVLVVLRQAA